MLITRTLTPTKWYGLIIILYSSTIRTPKERALLHLHQFCDTSTSFTYWLRLSSSWNTGDESPPFDIISGNGLCIHSIFYLHLSPPVLSLRRSFMSNVVSSSRCHAAWACSLRQFIIHHPSKICCIYFAGRLVLQKHNQCTDLRGITDETSRHVVKAKIVSSKCSNSHGVCVVWSQLTQLPYSTYACHAYSAVAHISFWQMASVTSFKYTSSRDTLIKNCSLHNCIILSFQIAIQFQTFWMFCHCYIQTLSTNKNQNTC